MPIETFCSCGATYHLKDEFAGQTVQCLKCGHAFRAPDRVAGPSSSGAGDPLFARDRFLLRQQHLSISEKYHVSDEHGEPLLFVERPAHLLRNLGAVLAGMLAAAVVGVLLGILASVMPPNALQVTVWIIAALGALAALFFVAVGLSRKRDILFYRDPSKQDLVLQVFQNQKVAFIHATYTITDAAGNLLGHFEKNHLYDLFRKRWDCTGPTGARLCVAHEESIILSLLRRVFGQFFGLLRTNFIILAPDEVKVLGEFNRKFTILDRYALSLTGDPGRTLDRRIALALGVLLDTGERR